VNDPKTPAVVTGLGFQPLRESRCPLR